MWESKACSVELVTSNHSPVACIAGTQYSSVILKLFVEEVIEFAGVPTVEDLFSWDATAPRCHVNSNHH